MPFSLVWLPEVLKSAGLKVALDPGWETRGHGDVGSILGVICHHTAGARHGNMPSLKVIREGRTGLRGPLSQLGLGRDGTFFVVAAGRCSHAGAGIWNGLTNGNTNFIGIEAENTGGGNDFPWPEVQMDAYRRGVAAIFNHLGLRADACCGHREYARPLGRKSDPVFDMNAFRASVAEIMTDGTPPVLIPPEEPGGAGRPTLRRGATGPLVEVVQRKVGVVPVNGTFGPKTEAGVREFQRALGMVPDGIVGPKTWTALDAAP
jgi:peptidoglycan hydrolase-like protein with peptidoglycan-binding domain